MFLEQFRSALRLFRNCVAASALLGHVSILFAAEYGSGTGNVDDPWDII